MLRLELAWRDDPEIADLLRRFAPPAPEVTRTLPSAQTAMPKRSAHSR
jgi:hypothetical protein